MAKEKSNDKERQDHRSNSVLRRLLFGQVVTSDFFARNWVTMLVILFCLMTYISGKYTCMVMMSTSERLANEVDETHKEFVRVRSEYMGKIRESQMQVRIDSLHLVLQHQETPPYRFKLDSENK